MKFILFLFFTASLSEIEEDYSELEYDYEDYQSGDYEDYYDASGEEDYEEDYGSGEGSGDFYEYETKYQDTELSFLPELLSGPSAITAQPGDSVSLPCEARDADQFVRVWMKEESMLFTGSIRHTEDPRLELTGESELSITSAREEDSGEYQCRIMVETPLSVTHSLTVTNTFNIQAEPSRAVVSVPLRGETTIACRTIGASAEIEWTRDGAVFSGSETYRQRGREVHLENVTIQDAGYYYCTAQGPGGETKTASIQVKVLFPTSILSLEKNVLQTGRGFETELTCVVTGEPRPRVMWYRDGQILNITQHSRLQYQQAGSKHILIIQNTQGSDYGTYMCYATNSIGSVQKMVTVGAEDRTNKDLQYGEEETEEEEDGGGGGGGGQVRPQQLKSLRKQLERHRRVVAGFRQKIEREVSEVRHQLASRISQRKRTEGVVASTSDFYDELGRSGEGGIDTDIIAFTDRLDDLYLNMRNSVNDVTVRFSLLERNSQDEVTKLWDNIHDLHELANLTTKNLDEIYDKDILKMQNFQIIAEGELTKLKTELGHLQTGAVGHASQEQTDDFSVEEKFFQLQDSLQMMRNSNKINQNIFQNFRDELTRAYRDIDQLKKFRQKTGMKMQQLERFISRLDLELIEETISKVTEIESQITRLEGIINKANQMMRKMSQDEGEDEKVDLLVKEIQTMKTQMFFLQQSILQMRSQDQLALEVAEGEVGPAYSSEMATDIARIATELEILTGRVDVLESQAADDRWVERRDFDIRNNAMVERMDEIEDKVDNTRIVVDACEVASESVRRDITSLSSLLSEVREKQELAERESVKYRLILSGLRKRRKLERPLHLIKTVNDFINSTLGLEGVEVEEATRVEDGKARRPQHVSVKFSSLKEKNQVLQAGRKLTGKVKISEEFTENVKIARKKLAEFAKKNSKQTKSRWALQQDRLFFTGNIYSYDPATETVIKVGKVE